MNFFAHSRLLTVLSLAVALTATSCKKDKKEDPAPSASMSFKVGGTSMTPKFSYGSYDATKELIISGGDSSVATNDWGIIIDVDSITAPGTVTNGTVTYLLNDGSASTKFWESDNSGGSSQIKITSLDVTSNRASGTFSGTLTPDAATGATGNKVVTEGTFTNIPLSR